MLKFIIHPSDVALIPFMTKEQTKMPGIKKTKILWKHPNLRDYRLPLFDYLASKYEIHFLFTRPSFWDWKYRHTILSSKKNNLQNSTFSTKLFITCLIRLEYDVLICSFIHSYHTLLSVIIAKLRRRKVIIWEERWVKKKTFKSEILDLAIKVVYLRLIDAFFVCGLRQKKILKWLGASENKIFIANESSVDLSKIPVRHYNVELDIKNRKIILFVGRIIACKGLDYLIRAFYHIEKTRKDVFLLIVGDGDFKSECMDLVKNLRVSNYCFAGEITDIQVKRYFFHISYLVVVPSIITAELSEGGPIVVPEAFSASRPVVVSDAVGSVNELVVDGVNGYTCKSKSVSDLVRKISLILDTSLYDDMCRYARRTYERRCDYGLINSTFSDCIESVTPSG